MSESADPIVKFLVMSYDITHAPEAGATIRPRTRTRVYMVPAHTTFPGFGGKRGGLVTGKTPSLIIRQTGPWGMRDVEYDINDASAWGCINTGLKLAAAEGTLHHVGLATE